MVKKEDVFDNVVPKAPLRPEKFAKPSLKKKILAKHKIYG